MLGALVLNQVHGQFQGERGPCVKSLTTAALEFEIRKMKFGFSKSSHCEKMHNLTKAKRKEFILFKILKD